MEPVPADDGKLRFGVFEINLPEGELRKRGRKVKLQEQPFRLLALLLRAPGQVVTREELQKTLWPAGTFVEFEQGLNTAIRKLRRALDDSADNPRFIETLPRKGYRFIAAVQGAEPGAAVVRAEGKTRVLWKIAIPVAGLLAVAAGIAWWAARRPSPVTGPKFTQLTRDSGLTTTPCFSPDGGFVAYASDRAGAGNLDIWIQQLGGGATLRLTSDPAADHSPSYAPDGKTIVFFSGRDGGGIYAIPSLGGNARLLVKGGGRPRVSPDGHWLAYFVGPPESLEQAGIWVAPISGGQGRPLHPEFRGAALPVWTPDSRHLAFLGLHPTEGFDIWVTSLDGSSLVRTGARDVLRNQSVRIGGLEAAGPDGRSLLFSGAFGDSYNLWRLPVSPGAWKAVGPAERLTSGLRETGASLGPRGSVVFSDSTGRLNLWALPVDAVRGAAHGPLRKLTGTADADFGCDASAGGGKVAFLRKGRRLDIWIKDLAGGEEAMLVEGSQPAGVSMPRISRDGAKVAFQRLEQGKRAIYVSALKGGEPVRVCEDCGPPSNWSPDGRRLLYLRPQEPRSRVHLLDTQTGAHLPLIEHPELPLYVPRFSPDGRWVACKADIDIRRTRIFLVPLKGTGAAPLAKWVALTEGESWDDLPRWSPDGDLIYFTSNRDGYRCIWARRLAPGSKQPRGEPFAVRHLHDIQLSMTVLSLGQMELALTRDQLIFPLAELRSNVWMMER